MVRVLFVCLGNICRSPMAEAVFRDLVSRSGLEQRFHVDSAGTGNWHLGEPPHAGTRRELRANGIEFDHRARIITTADLEQFDYVVAMDRQNLRDIQAMGPARARVELLLAYAPSAGLDQVPDPYYDGRFSLVYSLVGEACRGLLAAIRTERGF